MSDPPSIVNDINNVNKAIKDILKKVNDPDLSDEELLDYTGISLNGETSSDVQDYNKYATDLLVRSKTKFENSSSSTIPLDRTNMATLYNDFKTNTEGLITLYYNLNENGKTSFNNDLKRLKFKGFNIDNTYYHDSILDKYDKTSKELHSINKDMKENHKVLKENTKKSDFYEDRMSTITIIYYIVLSLVILLAISLSVFELSQGVLLGIATVVVALLVITYRTPIPVESFYEDTDTKDTQITANENNFKKHMTAYIKQSINNILTNVPEGMFYNLEYSLDIENRKYKNLETDQHQDINNVKSYNSKVLSDTLDYRDATYLLLYLSVVMLIIKMLGISKDMYRYLYIILIVLGVLWYLIRSAKRTRVDPTKKFFPL